MNKDLINISGVGEKVNRYFKEKGLWNTYDLVTYLPKKYSDFTQTSYEMLKHLDTVTVIGTIQSELKTFKKKVELTTTFLNLDEHLIKLSIFGRAYLDKQLKIGDEVIVKGKYNFFNNEITVLMISKQINIPEIKPVYEIDRVPDSNVSKIIQHIFNDDVVDIFETLPPNLIYKYDLLPRKTALYHLHLPKSRVDLDAAILRQKYEEAFFHLLSYQMYMAPKQKRTPIAYDIKQVKSYIQRLPYQLTFDQQEAVNDIFKDYHQDYSTYRLIQGDVGSGKTFVTFIALLGMLTAGFQVAFMAPTEILARQHHENFIKYFNDIKSCVLTSSSKDRKTILESIESGDMKVVFGTHLLASESTRFHQLGLVIIDEQHKFGVDTRDQLIKKSVTKDTLYLSATPIPRSLTLTFFGDLEISTIKQKPVKKPPIKTMIIDYKAQDKIIDILKSTQDNNEQSFVVVPSIIDNQNKVSIESAYEFIKPFINDQDLYVIHGKLKIEEIDLIMDRFIQNPRGVLLSTTIIEVGIDVKNATTMIIMGADSFGLSQLHQIRGRVGRGDKPGFCYLVTSKTDALRLDFLEKNDDGFKLSEYDLKLRGPGIFSGLIQSGQVKFKYLDLSSDMKILRQMKIEAKYYLTHIDKYLYLKKRIQQIVI